MVRRSWVQKYRRPPTHALWAGQPFAVHLHEFFEDKWVQKTELEAQLRNSEVDPAKRLQIMEGLESLRALLEEGLEEVAAGGSGDPVLDAIELAEELDDDIDMDITPEEAKEYLRTHGH